MSKENHIVVEVDAPMEDTVASIVLIQRFLKKNRIKINLSIAYDFSTDDCGTYYPNMKGQSYRIFVNPLRCKSKEEVCQQSIDEPFCPGYCADLTLFGITIHEFCHLLQYKVFTQIISDFSQKFPTERFYLNSYCNHDVRDELAEIMTLYITNPYLLWLVSKKHFDFCKKYFKSPVPCSLNRCFIIYDGFPICVKEDLKNHWGIVFNISTKKFERVNNGKIK